MERTGALKGSGVDVAPGTGKVAWLCNFSVGSPLVLPGFMIPLISLNTLGLGQERSEDQGMKDKPLASAVNGPKTTAGTGGCHQTLTPALSASGTSDTGEPAGKLRMSGRWPC